MRVTAYIEPRNMSIYAIRCNSTGRLYIGMSRRVGERVDEHLQSLRRNDHQVKLLQKDYNAHGKENFSFYVLEEGLTEKEARQREQYFMEEYDTRNPAHGYNATHPRYGKNTMKRPTPPLIYEKPPKAELIEEARP